MNLFLVLCILILIINYNYDFISKKNEKNIEIRLKSKYCECHKISNVKINKEDKIVRSDFKLNKLDKIKCKECIKKFNNSSIGKNIKDIEYEIIIFNKGEVIKRKN